MAQLPPNATPLTVPPRPGFARAPAPCEQAQLQPYAWWHRVLPLLLLLCGGMLTGYVSEVWVEDEAEWGEPFLVWMLGLTLSVLSSVAFWVTISARHREENHALQRHTGWEVLSRVALAAPHPLAVTDRHLRISWINVPFMAQLGGNEAQVYGLRLTDWLREQGVERWELARLDKALDQRVPADLVFRPESGARAFVASFTPSFEGGGVFKGYVVRFEDVAASPPVATVFERLEHENAALRQAIDRLAIVSETDRAGRIVRVNPKFVEISGYEEEELLGQTHRIVNSGVHPHEFWEHMWQTIGRGQPWRGEVCNRAKDGHLYWVDSLVAPIMDTEGRVERYISIRTDITHHRRAEEALEASQRMLARTGALARTGGWYLDVEAQQLYMSAECMHILDAEPDWASGVEQVLGYGRPHPIPAVDAVRAAVLDHGRAFDTVIEIPVGKGGRRFIRLVGDMDNRDAAGARLIGAAQDVTEQVEAQRRVEQSESILRSAIDAMGEAFALYDTQDRLVYCNDQYRELASREPEELLIGSRYEDVVRQGMERGLVAPEGLDQQEWVRHRLLKTRQVESSETRRLTTGRWIRFVDRRTSDGFHVALRVDVTEMQRALEAAQAASRGKSQFLANMSHEIRTPMNAVMGMLQLMHHTPLSDRQRDLADKALGAARSLLGVVNDILDYSKVEAGKMSLDPQPFDVDALLSELSAILSSTLGDKRLDLVFDIDPHMPRALLGDSLRLRQVLINLCANAIKFTERGEVVLSVRVVARHEETVRLAFEVRDTGPGMSAEQQQRLFHEYEQADASTARRYGGTGLGLMISQRLVGLMGGELSVQSTLGRGSAFGFELILPVVEAEGLAQAAAAFPTDGLTVWLIDGHAASRAALVPALQACGWSVQAFAGWAEVRDWSASGAEAARGCDVLLMDLATASGMDPASLQAWVERIRAVGAPKLSRVVVLTLCAGGIEAILESGRPASLRWESVLIKPLTLGMVARAVVEGLGHREAALPPAPTAPQARLDGLRVLLVEDDVLNQQVAMEVLRLEGAEAVLAQNGLAAIERLRVEPRGFDVVLMDMEMPVLDGLEATRQIRRDPALRALPVIAMTANHAGTDAQVCLAAGMDAHLAKPFTVDGLVEVVRERVAVSRGAARASLPVPTSGADETPPPVPSALLEAFRRAAPQYLQRLDRALAQQDRRELQTLGHQLRSSTAFLGLKAVSVAAEALEAQAKSAPPDGFLSPGLVAHAEALREALGAAQDALAASGDSPSAMTSLDDEALRQDLLALHEALCTADAAVFDLMDRAWALHGAAVPGLEAVRDAVDRADFETARRTLEHGLLRPKAGGPG